MTNKELEVLVARAKRQKAKVEFMKRNLKRAQFMQHVKECPGCQARMKLAQSFKSGGVEALSEILRKAAGVFSPDDSPFPEYQHKQEKVVH